MTMHPPCQRFRTRAHLTGFHKLGKEGEKWQAECQRKIRHDVGKSLYGLHPRGKAIAIDDGSDSRFRLNSDVTKTKKNKKWSHKNYQEYLRVIHLSYFPSYCFAVSVSVDDSKFLIARQGSTGSCYYDR